MSKNNSQVGFSFSTIKKAEVVRALLTVPRTSKKVNAVLVISKVALEKRK